MCCAGCVSVSWVHVIEMCNSEIEFWNSHSVRFCVYGVGGDDHNRIILCVQGAFASCKVTCHILTMALPHFVHWIHVKALTRTTHAHSTHQDHTIAVWHQNRKKSLFLFCVCEFVSPKTEKFIKMANMWVIVWVRTEEKGIMTVANRWMAKLNLSTRNFICSILYSGKSDGTCVHQLTSHWTLLCSSRFLFIFFSTWHT